MKIGDVASDSFFLVQLDSDPADLVTLLRSEPSATHVVVHRVEGGQEWYYLVSRNDALFRLIGSDPTDRVADLLDLGEETLATVCETVDTLSANRLNRAVVKDRGQVVGFVDQGEDDTGAGFLPMPAPETRPSRVPESSTRGGGRRGVFRGSGARGGALESAAGDAGGGPASPGMVEGSLEAEFPEQVEQHAEVSLLVSLVAESQAAASIAVSVEAGSEIDVIVQPRKGFKVLGASEQKLKVVDPDDALPVRFKLEGVDVGPGEIRVLAFHDGACLGQMRLQPEVVAAGTPSGAPTTHVQEIDPSPEKTPDLTLLIEESLAEGKLDYHIRLIATDPALGLPLKRFGPLTLEVDPLAYFSEFFQDIERLKVVTPQDKEEAARVMERKGAELYDLVFPEDLKKVMWRVRDRIQSLIIQSEEPWIPWELCRMSGEDADGMIEEGPFLCEQYIISRWNPEEAFKQPLSLKETALVVPQDSGLAFAQAERDMILSFKSGERNVTPIPATPADVQAALASGIYTVFHFTGHGMMKDDNPDRSVMRLEDRKAFRPEDVSGRVCNLKKGRPIVFLNACQIGAGAMGLTGMGGWAHRFVKSGAGAFLGAYWSVFDQPALGFAEAFYDELISGKTIGEAVFEARKAIRDQGDPTWLAYTLFAHPLSAIVDD